MRINGERAKSGNRILPGDTIELVKNQLRYRLDVLSLPKRRGPASEMATCYEEDAASQQKRHELMDQIKEDRRQMARTRGKPDKHTRRKLLLRNRGQAEGPDR